MSKCHCGGKRCEVGDCYSWEECNCYCDRCGPHNDKECDAHFPIKENRKVVNGKVAVVVAEDYFVWYGRDTDKMLANQEFRFDPMVIDYVEKYVELCKQTAGKLEDFQCYELACRFEREFEEKYGWKPAAIASLHIEYVNRGERIVFNRCNCNREKIIHEGEILIA